MILPSKWSGFFSPILSPVLGKVKNCIEDNGLLLRKVIKYIHSGRGTFDYSHAEIFDLLIQGGQNVNYFDGLPLAIALVNGHEDLAGYLISKGGKVGTKYMKPMLYKSIIINNPLPLLYILDEFKNDQVSIDLYLEIAVSAAVKYRRLDMLQMLAQNGANLHVLQDGVYADDMADYLKSIGIECGYLSAIIRNPAKLGVCPKNPNFDVKGRPLTVKIKKDRYFEFAMQIGSINTPQELWNYLVDLCLIFTYNDEEIMTTTFFTCDGVSFMKDEKHLEVFGVKDSSIINIIEHISDQRIFADSVLLPGGDWFN